MPGGVALGVDQTANAAARFGALSTVYDDATRRQLLACGIAPGWHCLEVGAGGGSIARWLGDRVGAGGRVVARDVDTRFLDALPSANLDVRRHDITRDPLPERAFDLVHARMVLIHLPARDEVLARLAAALKPGGWLVCEEFDSMSLQADPATHPGEVVLDTHDAMGRINDACGVDRRYGRRLFGRFRALGLTNLGAEGHLFVVQPESGIASLLRASYERRRCAMIDAGYVTVRQFDDDLARTRDADFMMPSPIMWTVWGRRPE